MGWDQVEELDLGINVWEEAEETVKEPMETGRE